MQMQMANRAGEQKGFEEKAHKRWMRNVEEPVYRKLVFGVGHYRSKCRRDGVQGSGSMARSKV